MPDPALRVTVENLETGTVETSEVADDDYFLVLTGDCHIAHATVHASGTHVLTIKGRGTSDA